MTQVVAGGTTSRQGPSVVALLSLESVTVRHRVDRGFVTVLDGVSLDVLPGEFIAICGERHSGKTALLRVAAGIERPAAGGVRVRGQLITGVSGGHRARRTRAIGYVPKKLRLAEGKRVVDHLALPLIAERVPVTVARARAYEALDRVGALALAPVATDDLDPGQEALLGVALALVRRPSVVLADEPGATAETAEREQVLAVLRSLARESRDLGLVITARDETVSTGATRVLTLSDGRLTGAIPRGRVIPLPARAR